MASVMQSAGLGPQMGGPFGSGLGGGFPAPGTPSYQQSQTRSASTTEPPSTVPTSPNQTSTPTPNSPGTQGTTGGAQTNAPNPYDSFARLLSNSGTGSAGTAGSPFGMVDPALVQQLLGGMGGAGGSPLSPFGGFGAGAASAQPADTRSPEERFATQLAQMNEMGFIDARQNVRALLATNGNVKLAEALLSGGELGGRMADLSAANNRGRTALHLAAEGNQVEMVKLLLRSGADPRAMSDGGWTALHNAAQEGHVEVVGLLLATNANINAELSNGMTPLHWAAFNGHEEVVKMLLNRGVSVNTGLSNIGLASRNPLEAAAYGGYLGIVQRLLEHGIHVHCYGTRALWEAAGEGHEEIVCLLLETGVTPNVHYNSRSGSALCRAIRFGHARTVQMLLDFGARVFEAEMKEALSKGNEAIAGMLLNPYISSLFT